MKIHIPDIERLPEAAAQFIETFGDRITGGHGCRIFAFQAPMGAGKTTFISEVCRLLGSDDTGASPTFSIANVYDTEKWGKVVHLDCYRLEDEEEAFEAGVEDFFDSGLPCFVEWPERIPGLLPEDTVWVSIKVNDKGEREISYEDPVD